MAKVWAVTAEPVDAPISVSLLRDYLEEIVARYHGRPVRDGEVEQALAEEPNDGLVPPQGLFLVARYGDEAVGCVGVRLLADGVAEMKRVFLRQHVRGFGGSAAIIEAAERAGRDLGARLMRLDTRGDLVEARAVYARHGYDEIPAYAPSKYAEHWFEKQLGAV